MDVASGCGRNLVERPAEQLGREPSITISQ
jgi:hypothetical protein